MNQPGVHRLQLLLPACERMSCDGAHDFPDKPERNMFLAEAGDNIRGRDDRSCPGDRLQNSSGMPRSVFGDGATCEILNSIQRSDSTNY